MTWVIAIVYFFSLLMIFLFSLVQSSLVFHYRKSRKKGMVAQPLSSFPVVTVQLPVYNEKYVIERLIDGICQLDYPKDLLEIQVLDDSSDETTQLATDKIRYWQSEGINIHLIRRPDRTGFKAGALQHGLGLSRGEYLAIFDADFLPKRDFLKKILPYFQPETGMIQARWGHLNEDYNLITRMQAFGLNAHFTVEQGGRQASGHFINFNGTGGIWRKRCIEEAGGWQFDTLTEDLDLSYRAQLSGWKLKYLEHVVAPAELPVVVSAVKSQQYRWNKGAAETARKNLGRLFRSRITFSSKVHAVAHLLNSSVFLFLFLAAITSVPMLFLKSTHSSLLVLGNLSSMFALGFIVMTIFYWTAVKAINPSSTYLGFLKNLPLFLTFSMGLSLYNSLAVAEGYLGIKSSFIRTPKFNILVRSDSWKGNHYLQKTFTPHLWIEGVLSVYFLFGLLSGILLQDYSLIPFHGLLSIGFGAVCLFSVKPPTHA